MPKSKHRRPSHRRKANRPVATLPQSSVRPYTPEEGESTAHPCSPETKQEISVHSVSSVAKSPSASANSTVNASAPSVFNPNPTIVEADSPECQEMSGNVSDFHTPDTPTSATSLRASSPPSPSSSPLPLTFRAPATLASPSAPSTAGSTTLISVPSSAASARKPPTWSYQTSRAPCHSPSPL